jgi:hypothetical protein
MGVYVPYTTTTTTGAADLGPDSRIQNRAKGPLCCVLARGSYYMFCVSAARKARTLPG